jgi:hypothetical protein
MDSILNEMKLDPSFKRGAVVWFKVPGGKASHGKFVMAASAPGYIVLNMGGAHGTPKVVSLDSVLNLCSGCTKLGGHSTDCPKHKAW